MERKDTATNNNTQSTMNIEQIIIVVLLVVLGFMSYHIVSTSKMLQDDVIKRIGAIEDNENIVIGLDGLYKLTKLNGAYYHGYNINESFYIVWTGNKTAEEINRTDCHEACHHFVNLDPEHFLKYVDIKED